MLKRPLRLLSARSGSSPVSASELPGDWQCVQRTSHCAAANLEHMGVNHGRRYVGVAEQVLHGPNIAARLQEVGREMLYINQRLPKAEQAEANARAKALKDALADLDEAARLQDADALRKGYIKVASSFGLYAQILPQAVQESLKQV